jgi:hypothetical protein
MTPLLVSSGSISTQENQGLAFVTDDNFEIEYLFHASRAQEKSRLAELRVRPFRPPRPGMDRHGSSCLARNVANRAKALVGAVLGFLRALVGHDCPSSSAALTISVLTSMLSRRNRRFSCTTAYVGQVCTGVIYLHLQDRHFNDRASGLQSGSHHGRGPHTRNGLPMFRKFC